MEKKNKKILISVGLVCDLLIVIFLFITSILVLTVSDDRLSVLQTNPESASNYYEWFAANPIAFALIVVLPLFLLLFGNIAMLFLYVRASNKKKKVAVNDLNAEEKERLRKELLNDLNKEENDSSSK